MQFAVLPYQGLGPILFGMKRDEVRRTMSTPYKPFMKSTFSKVLTDAFASQGLHVYYDQDDQCNAIEVGKPGEVLLNGTSLVGKQFGEIWDWIESIDPDVKLNDTGLVSPEFGISLYAPSARKSRSAIIEGVLAFRRGYFS